VVLGPPGGGAEGVIEDERLVGDKDVSAAVQFRSHVVALPAGLVAVQPGAVVGDDIEIGDAEVVKQVKPGCYGGAGISVKLRMLTARSTRMPARCSVKWSSGMTSVLSPACRWCKYQPERNVASGIASAHR
jgi:hypothetical protein